jgi:polyhydroxyalkanoate synthesis regulator phasin
MRSLSLLFLTLLIAISPAAYAQHQHPAAAPAPAAATDAPSMNCEAMMQEMHASSTAMDDRLQQLVDDMNKAKGAAKVDRMAAVLNEMVTQRKQLREQMTAMMPKMMSHMSQHMQSGMMQGMSSMDGCPMMKSGQKSAEEHKH